EGVAYIPEDRRKALVMDLSIRENLMLNSYRDSSSLMIDRQSIVASTDELIDNFSIKTPSPLAPVRSLSGGNRQKVVVAREMSLKPPEGRKLIIIAENPTFGLDVGTTQFVREDLLAMRSAGAAIILVSSDLTEILTLSDEITVIYKGMIMGTVKAEDATRENIGLMMGGTKLTQEEI
ncbi:MAG: heme ABC transporter ATP-binding protein, partial [Candidatus Hodarchaeales archaeon]